MKYVENKFGILLTELREKQNVTLEQLCEGICTPSQLAKIEKGERFTDAMTQNRFLDRMGMTRESNGSFLFYDDYDDWNKRWAIIDSIEDEDGHEEELLEDYYSNNVKDSKVKLQFYLIMKAQMLIHRRLKLKELDINLTKQIENLYEQALKATVPSLDSKPIQKLKLSVDELNIYLEYVNVILSREIENNVVNNKMAEYIFNRYKELIIYIDGSQYNIPSKAKIYPKTVVYMYRQLEKYLNSQSDTKKHLCDELFKRCNIALEILRTDGTAYYMSDILTTRKKLLEKMIAIRNHANQEKVIEALNGILFKNNEWYNAMSKVYEDCGVSGEWIDCCYLYKELDVRCIGDVIRTRRRMLGMTRKELYDGICSDKTLDRIEANKTKGQRAIVTELFDRLNLSLDFQKLEVISDNREMIELFHRMKKFVNNNKFEEADRALCELRKGLPEHMINEQILYRDEVVIGWRMGRISDEEYIEGLKKGLEHTVLLKDIYSTNNRIYLSNSETSYVYSISLAYRRLKRYDEAYQYINVLYEYYEMCRKRGEVKKYLSMYGYIMSYVANLLGSMGRYNESDYVSREIIKYNMKAGKLGVIHNNIYSMAWNKDMQNTDKDTYRNIIYQCLCLSQLCKDSRYEEVYRKKIDTESP